MEKDNVTNPESKQETTNNQRPLLIRIERFHNLIEILDDRNKVVRLTIVVFIIGMLLFAGITFLALQLKRSFTYSDITTNALGTTTIMDEQKEVSYFLFNTAELWANSGIEVQKGDIISVYSSGHANTAIHKIDEASSNNHKYSLMYYDSDGTRDDPEDKRDRLRRQYRLFPNRPSGALIMQVAYPEKDSILNSTREREKPGKPQNQFCYIGGHHENLRITRDGTLFFAVNDIVLDTATIESMKKDNLKAMSEIAQKRKTKDTIRVSHTGNRKDSFSICLSNKDACIMDSINSNPTYLENSIQNCDSLLRIYQHYLKEDSTFKFGKYYDIVHHKVDADTYKTEMDYYLENNYYQAWFDDNVGSFLIVVEKINPNSKRK